MKYLILLMLGLSIGTTVSDLLEPVVGVLEAIQPVLEAENNEDSTYIESGLTITLGTELHKQTIGTLEENNSEASKERTRNLAQTTNIELKNNEKDVTDENNIVRPCDLDDTECIRKFLAQNSNCTPACGPIPDPLNIAQITTVASVVDITVTFGSFNINGLSSAKVVEFYINKETHRLVIAFKLTNLKEISPNTFLSYHRPAKEPIVLNDTTTILFTSLTLTIIIPGPYLRLDLAQAYVFFNDVIPPFTVGPGLAASLDPAVLKGFASIIPSAFPIARELFLTKSQLYSALIIQSSLCDFGIPLYSV